MANYASTVVDIALGEVGYLEKKSNRNLDSKTANAGSANFTKYGRDMHKLYPAVMDFPAAWCDAFVDWCFQKAYGVSNAKKLIGGNFNDYTVQSAQLYKDKKAYHKKDPKVGDQIFFKNSKRICHTGLVYKVDKTYVYTVEGNTSSDAGVVANGGGVFKKKYKLTNSRIDGYGRPKYDEEPKKQKYLGTFPTKFPARGHYELGDGYDQNPSFTSQIKRIQNFLNWCLGIKLTIDGDYGPKTVDAVKDFQAKYGLVDDGEFGPASLAKAKKVER